jgi:hypothetical protein
MKIKSIRRSSMVALAALMCLTSAATHAQESANPELDKCVKDEQIALTAKGAGMGALTGLGMGLLSGNKEDALKKAAAGAVVGGAAGFATAYFTAIEACYKKNPSWIPESKIERTKDYAKVKKETKYQPKEGIKAAATKLDMPTSVKAGTTLDLASTFYVLTPDGAESPVTLERKLFEIVDNKENPLPYTGKGSEERTIEPGEHKDTGRLPIPSGTKAGTQFRYEFSVSAGGKPASTVKQTVVVQ